MSGAIITVKISTAKHFDDLDVNRRYFLKIGESYCLLYAEGGRWTLTLQHTNLTDLASIKALIAVGCEIYDPTPPPPTLLYEGLLQGTRIRLYDNGTLHQYNSTLCAWVWAGSLDVEGQ